MCNNTNCQVDAFAAEPFKGNPAGVKLVDKRMPAERAYHLRIGLNSDNPLRYLAFKSKNTIFIKTFKTQSFDKVKVYL